MYVCYVCMYVCMYVYYLFTLFLIHFKMDKDGGPVAILLGPPRHRHIEPSTSPGFPSWPEENHLSGRIPKKTNRGDNPIYDCGIWDVDYPPYYDCDIL